MYSAWAVFHPEYKGLLARENTGECGACYRNAKLFIQ